MATTEVSELKKIDYSQIGSAKIKIGVITDARSIDPKTRIAENSEDKPTLYVDTKSDVASFISVNLLEIFKKLDLTADNVATDYVLTGEIKDFYVIEKNTYEGLVKINLQLKYKNKTIWTGQMLGTNKRFGRSYSLNNYLETLSDTLIEACSNLLSNAEFKIAFQTKTKKN